MNVTRTFPYKIEETHKICYLPSESELINKIQINTGRGLYDVVNLMVNYKCELGSCLHWMARVRWSKYIILKYSYDFKNVSCQTKYTKKHYAKKILGESYFPMDKNVFIVYQRLYLSFIGLL